MKILITGGAGYIGGRLSNFLRKKNLKIISTSRKKNKHGLKIIKWNSPTNLRSLCQGIDIIINCAGFDVHKSKTKSKTFVANSINPFNLFKVANENDVKLFIFLSTAHVYKNKLSGKIDEKTRTAAKHTYGLSKLDGEKRLINIKNKKTKLLILRPCNLFGYPNYKNKNCWKLLINSLIKSLVEKNKVTILSKDNNYRNYSSIRSFCEFIYSIIKIFKSTKKRIPAIMNYHSEKNLNITQIIHIILERLKKIERKNKLKIFYRHKFFKKMNKLAYQSLYQKTFKTKYDKHFDTEINDLILYCKKAFN